MSPFIIADAFDAKQFNITMIRYKFESLVNNLIDGSYPLCDLPQGYWQDDGPMLECLTKKCPRFVHDLFPMNTCGYYDNTNYTK